MALYAVDEDDLIYAGHANPRQTYWCMECFEPVKRRRGKTGLYHFYHLRAPASCRLYSKTEDHLFAQLSLQKAFAPGQLLLERPFRDINRVADVLWEAEKIVFEIQCSPITEKEAASRISDYASQGYQVVWLLDDKRYNKKIARPAEELLRQRSAYYLKVRKNTDCQYYDQFEIFDSKKRIKKAKPSYIDLQHIRRRPSSLPSNTPAQVSAISSTIYFLKDRTDRALRYPETRAYWTALEKTLPAKKRLPIPRWLKKIAQIYLDWIRYLILKSH